MDPENVTLRHEFVRCSKPACKRCNNAPGHGPYWYAYKREGGKVRKEYIGRRLPREYDDSLHADRHAVAYQRRDTFYHTHCIQALGYAGPDAAKHLADAGLAPVAPRAAILADLRGAVCPKCSKRFDV